MDNQTDSKRRFGNELAAFKKGESVDHESTDGLIVSKKIKANVFKLIVIFIVLLAVSYLIFLKPATQLSSLSSNASKLSIPFDDYVAEVDGINKSISANSGLLKDLYKNNIPISFIREIDSRNLIVCQEHDYLLKLYSNYQKSESNYLVDMNYFIQNYPSEITEQLVIYTIDPTYFQLMETELEDFALTNTQLLELLKNDTYQLYPSLNRNAQEKIDSIEEYEYLVNSKVQPTLVNAITEADSSNVLTINLITSVLKTGITETELLSLIQKQDIKNQFINYLEGQKNEE